MNNMDELAQSSIKALLRGELVEWQGLPPFTSVAYFITLYGTDSDGLSGRLSGHWYTYHDFKATKMWPDIRVWSNEGFVVRIDLDRPIFENASEQLNRLGQPTEERLPPIGYRYDEEDELNEFVYSDRGLVLYVTDPTLPGSSSEQRIVQVRAFTPMSVASYDGNLGGQEPRRIRHARR